MLIGLQVGFCFILGGAVAVILAEGVIYLIDLCAPGIARRLPERVLELLCVVLRALQDPEPGADLYPDANAERRHLRDDERKR